MKKYLVLLITVIMMSSCNTENLTPVKVLQTGEKFELNLPEYYIKGDTIMVYHNGHEWKMDEFWLMFEPDKLTKSIPQGEMYFKAVVL